MIKIASHLSPGDRVGIIAPGATFNPEAFEKGIEVITGMGLVPIFGPHLFKKDFLFAGTVAERTADFMLMANDKTLKAIWCVRGGCGTYAVAEEICKVKRVPAFPKILIGLSDITALHLLLTQKWKWPVVHGPLVDRLGNKQCPALEKKNAKQTLFEPAFKLEVTRGLTSLGKKGTVSGPVVGGNLAILVSSLGSSWELDSKGKILFLEDIGEPAYRLDRLLWQLGAAGKFKHIRGLIIGDFTDCIDRDGKERWQEVLKRNFKNAPFPVILGVKSGHGKLRLSLPFGLKATLSNEKKPYFKYIESFGPRL